MCFTLALMVAGQAHATFHLWTINEIYSSADGSVQFVKLHESSTINGENMLSNHNILCVSGTVTNTFVFSTNLPSIFTAGKDFVIGTSNLASVPGGLTPDFVFTNTVPFLFSGSGTINYAGVDSVSYSGLPSDGVASLVRSDVDMIFSPTNSLLNFSGQSNSIVPLRFSSIVNAGTNVLLTFPTATGPNRTIGPTYEVLTNSTLNSANWASLTNVVGDGTVQTPAIPASAPQLFFRLRVP